MVIVYALKMENTFAKKMEAQDRKALSCYKQPEFFTSLCVMENYELISEL